MSTVKSVLARNIEENIAPVIYFHQLDPETAAQEVREYVFTSREVRDSYQGGGIHEQMTRLLTEIWVAVTEGRKLPASWISGFFGSGKSSFAKLLGLALDGMRLPDGATMDQALLERDDTPKAAELRAAWLRLSTAVQSMAVVFDIGTAAKNNESIPHTAYRQVMEKLGYSSHDGVAHFELALEDEGRYAEFEAAYRAQYGKDWTEQKNSGLAPQKFRTVYKSLYPEQDELMETSTFDIHRLPIKKLVENLLRALGRRAPGRTVFMVVDEVSQYINLDHNKMLDLQSFVSEIGGRAKPGQSPLWLLVTGQEKLEEEHSESVLFKLKDRFPEALRVHLDRANVREVVERRLLKKRPGSALEALVTETALDGLRLYAYDCDRAQRDEVIANYPLLPGHIPLFMDITQSIRNTSARTQSDAGGVRSVLNNIWDLFNRPPVLLKDRPLGELLTLDQLYDIIGSSVDSDVQLTLHRIFEKHPAPAMESRVVKAIALLEMNGEQRPVSPELLASLLYPRLGSGPVLAEVELALKTLKGEGWIQFHEKTGYSIQNNAAQDWNRQKNELTVPLSEIEDQLKEALLALAESAGQPVYQGARFPLVAYWGRDQRLSSRNEPTSSAVCFHWVGNASRREKRDEWLALSREEPKRFHWVSGDTSALELMAREYCRSVRMVSRYRSQGQLQPMHAQLLYREQAEGERLYAQIRKDLGSVWMEGRFYYDGTEADPAEGGGGFAAALKREVESRLGRLYHQFEQGNIDIKDGDFKQLLERDTAGLSTVFLDRPGGLGIAAQDGGRILFSPAGAVPRAILAAIEEKSYLSGENLLALFAGPPYGYSRLVIKSAVLGLLRDEKILVRGENGSDISSVLDPGARNTFESDREFNKAEVERRQGDEELGSRDRTAIRQFFERELGLANVDNSSDMLADLCFKHFVRIKDTVSELQRKLDSLGLALPEAIRGLNRALSECLGDRHVDKALRRVKANLGALSEGYPRLKDLLLSMSPSTEEALRSLKDILRVQAGQLAEVDALAPALEQRDELAAHLEGDSPWRGYADVKPAAEALRRHYAGVRAALLRAQEENLEAAMDEIKLRPEFGRLDEDNQFMVLKQLRDQRQDTSEEAVQPSLLVLSQVPARLTEALSRAHRALDRMAPGGGEGGGGPGSAPIHTVRIDLRNKVVTSEAELDEHLARLRADCLAQLRQGARVRFE